MVTNDIYTKEDAEFLIRQGTLPPDRVLGVETGGCPHAAIREDASMNLEAIAELEALHPGLELIFVESGGDNLAAAFSPELVDAFIYVIDVAGGDKIPRKGGPGIKRSGLLVINKIDLAPHVGASLEVMDRDARRMRGDRPFVFTNLMSGDGLGRCDRLAGAAAGSRSHRFGQAPAPAIGALTTITTLKRNARPAFRYAVPYRKAGYKNRFWYPIRNNCLTGFQLSVTFLKRDNLV